MVSPGVYFFNGVNTCVLPNGTTITGSGGQCSTTANLPQRRKFTLERPQGGQYIGTLDSFEDGGTSTYHGLLVSVQRRAEKGLTIGANYTWSHCVGDNANGGSSPNVGTAYQFVNDRDRDRGSEPCDRSHIQHTAGLDPTPQFTNGVLHALATGWS